MQTLQNIALSTNAFNKKKYTEKTKGRRFELAIEEKKHQSPGRLSGSVYVRLKQLKEIFSEAGEKYFVYIGK